MLPPPTTREGLEKVTVEREELYRRPPPEGDPIPLTIQTALINNDSTSKEEIVAVVQAFHTGRVVGTFVILAENIKTWLERPHGRGP